MQCLVFDGLGDGLGSGDADELGLGEDPTGVLLPAVDVPPAGRLSAGSGCLWAATRVGPRTGVCLWRARSLAPRTGGVLCVTGVITARTGAECGGSVRTKPTPMMTAMISAADPAAA
jgi:hypothetical protein